MKQFRLAPLTTVQLLLTLVLTFAGQPLTACASAQDEPMSFSLDGKITQILGNKLTVNTEGNIVFRVVCNEKTLVTRKDGGPGSPKDLSVNTRIHVDGELTESGDIIARKVKIQSGATDK